MANIFLFLGIAFLLTFLIGRVLEKIRVPWIFAALLIGSFLSVYNPFEPVTSSPAFEFMATLGMYLLLFIIGFEINLREIKKSSRFILKATFFIIFLEAVFGSLLIRFVFEYSWLVSFLIALSFATIGEAILVPILDEFKIINTKLGQSIIGIGTIDDIIEIILLILIGVLIGTKSFSYFNIFITFSIIGVLFLLAVGFRKLKEHEGEFKFLPIENLFLLILFVLFLFLGIGEFAHVSPIAALLAGVALNTFIPDSRMGKVKTSVKTFCYGFFVPIFFLWIGSEMDLNYLIKSPLLVFAIVAVSSSAKILGSYIIGKKELGSKKSILLGTGLSVRFSTGIVIIKILLENNLITTEIYSVILASTIIFTFLVPLLFSNLIVRWMKNRKVSQTGR